MLGVVFVEDCLGVGAHELFVGLDVGVVMMTIPLECRGLIHERSIVDGRLSVRLPGHEHEARSGLRIDHRKRATRSENGNLRAARSPCVGAEACLSFQQVHEAVELRRDRAAEDSAPRQLDVQDEPRGPKFDRRALPYQHPHDRLTFLPNGHVLRIEELRARLSSLGS